MASGMYHNGPDCCVGSDARKATGCHHCRLKCCVGGVLGSSVHITDYRWDPGNAAWSDLARAMRGSHDLSSFEWQYLVVARESIASMHPQPSLLDLLTTSLFWLVDLDCKRDTGHIQHMYGVAVNLKREWTWCSACGEFHGNNGEQRNRKHIGRKVRIHRKYWNCCEMNELNSTQLKSPTLRSIISKNEKK